MGAPPSNLVKTYASCLCPHTAGACLSMRCLECAAWVSSLCWPSRSLYVCVLFSEFIPLYSLRSHLIRRLQSPCVILLTSLSNYSLKKKIDLSCCACLSLSFFLQILIWSASGLPCPYSYLFVFTQAQTSAGFAERFICCDLMQALCNSCLYTLSPSDPPGSVRPLLVQPR